MPRRAVFLDRDGVINQEVGYLSRWEDLRLVPGIIRLCLTAQRLGYHLVVVTNQSGIARGLYSEADFAALMQQLSAFLAEKGVHLSATYHCPYHPTHGVGALRREHEDRKPSPGMLRRAAVDLGLELAECLMVGDRCSDVAAANAAGVRQAFLLRGTEEGPCVGQYLEIAELGEMEEWILRDDEQRRRQP